MGETLIVGACHQTWNSDLFTPYYPVMDLLFSNLRHAFRTLAQSRGLSITAILALGLGIGANTAIFSVVNAVLLKPLPYPEPDRLLTVQRSFRNGGGGPASVPKFVAWRAGTTDVFAGMAAYDFSGPGINLASEGTPEQVKGIHASMDFFRVFGAAPALGRTFSADEDAPGGAKVAVLAGGIWKRRFGGDPSIVGSSIKLDGEPHVVVGVLDEQFRPDPPAEVFLPLQADPNTTNQGHYLLVSARLKPGVTLAVASAKLRAAGEEFRGRNPKWMNPDESVGARPMIEQVVGELRRVLLVLLGTVGMVLLIACANVANLLLARAAGRQREIAIRAAIGAGRWHIIRQLLTESVMLGIGGGLVGLLIGAWGVRALLAVAPLNIPRVNDLAKAGGLAMLDGSVLAFTAAVALATGLLFGLFPALHLSKPDLNTTLKESGGRSLTGFGHSRARGFLVVGEMAMAVILLAGAALLIRSFIELRNVRPGFDPRNLLVMESSMGGGRFHKTAAVERFQTQVTQRIEALPGVVAATATLTVPLEGMMDLPFTIEGRPPTDGQYNGDEIWLAGGYHFFEALGMPLVRGRKFNEQDTGNSLPIVVIDEAMAAKYWPGEDPVGRRITIGKGLGPEFDDPPRIIVGVVGNTRHRGLERPVQPAMYVPLSQMPDGITQLGLRIIPLSWLVRTAGDPRALAGPVQREISAVDRQVAAAHIRTMEDILALASARQSFNTILLAIFAGLALVLAAIGIYGLMSYNVAQRSHEIAIRMALGAGGREMVHMVVWQGMKLAIAGAAVGLAGALALTRLLESMLFGVRARDPITLALVAAALLAVSALATLLPAVRATRVDPVAALRGE